MARIYTNENFPRPAAEVLRRLGHDVVTVQERGEAAAGATDEPVLEFAASEKRVLVTLNRRHFIRLHEEVSDHAGIVVCSVDPDFERLAARIHERIDTEAPMGGKLVRVNRS